MGPGCKLQEAAFSSIARHCVVSRIIAITADSSNGQYMVGSLIIMAAITIANMRRGVLLHKLILIELILGTFHGTFIFNTPPVYDWYLSVTAIFLNISWSLHNVIAWIKTKPFLSRKWSIFYIGTVILAQPYWVLEIYANFAYFNGFNDVFLTSRPYEPLFRDPWWIFSVINLFWNIHVCYRLPVFQIIRISPRFGVLLTAMLLSISFIILDVLSVTGVLSDSLPDGLNPFWKLAFVFKCLTDSIILDDFKTALDRLQAFKEQRENFWNDQEMGVIDTSQSTNGELSLGISDHATAQERGQDGEQAQSGQEISFFDALNTAGTKEASREISKEFSREVSKRGRGVSARKQRPEDPLSEAAIEQDRLEEAKAKASVSSSRPVPILDRNASKQNARRESASKGPSSTQVEGWDDIDMPTFASTGDFGRERFASETDNSSTDGKSLTMGASWHEHVGG